MNIHLLARSVHQAVQANVVEPIARIAAYPSDSAEVRFQKRFALTAMLLGAVPAQLGLGALLLAFKEPYAGWSTVGFAVFDLVLVVLVAITPRHFPQLKLIAFVINLLSPFIGTLLLGGLINAGFSQLWSAMAPLLAIVVYSVRQAIAWFSAFVAMLMLTVLLQPYLRVSNNLPSDVLLLLSLINAGGTSSLAFALLLYAHQELRREQARAEQLLLNILPTDIAAILKTENRVIADQFDSVSILFADIVNFTPLCAEMTPSELVALLNEVFSYFDALVDRYGLEKIKTIGDCYMVAAGVPRPRPDHARILARFALDIQAHVGRHTFRERQLTFRIGINSGPVVAGVIGRRKFIYDLWGDSVNTASRMESYGNGGVIQITESTYHLIKHEYTCAPQGSVQVKGKGLMPVWYILGEKAE